MTEFRLTYPCNKALDYVCAGDENAVRLEFIHNLFFNIYICRTTPLTTLELPTTSPNIKHSMS